MTWKDLAEKLTKDLEKKQQELSNLQFELTGCQEQLKNSTTTHAHLHNGPVQQFVNLQHELESERTKKVELAKQVASLSETLQNTLSKYDKANKRDHEENQALKQQNEALRKLQTTQAQDQAVSASQKDLEDQVARLQEQNGTLQRVNDSLQRQLQLEKAENASKLAFMRSDPSKGYDQDDEEPLPTENAAMKEKSRLQSKMGSAEPATKFKVPNLSEEMKSILESSKPPQFVATSMENIKVPDKKQRKRKRSAQEEIDEELAELDIDDLKEAAEPRRKRRPIRRYGTVVPYPDIPDEISSNEPTRRATSEDSEYLPNASASKQTKLNKQTKSTPAKNNTPVEPLSPISFIRPADWPEPSSTFTFKAVCTYGKAGNPYKIYHSADLHTMTELWDRIAINTNLWESCAGADWKWEYERQCHNAKAPVCVTRKLRKQRTNWHKGFEGIYACKDCAEGGRPCFAYVETERDETDVYGEMRLLPLREGDRKRVVEKDREIRWWVNDGVKLVDEVEMDEDMDWD